MKKINVSFKGKSYPFTYYSTFLGTQHLFFIITEDERASKMLVENHYFISFDVRQNPPQFLFNGILGTREETEFKNAISDAVFEDHFNVPQTQEQQNEGAYLYPSN